MIAMAQTLFAGFAFAGAGTLMHYLEPNAYARESGRHNLAVEELTKAKEKWYEGQVKRKNEIQELQMQLSNANANINDTNHSLDLLRKVVADQNRVKPRLDNYYEPSKKMKSYQGLVIGGVGLASGYAIHSIWGT